MAAKDHKETKKEKGWQTGNITIRTGSRLKGGRFRGRFCLLIDYKAGHAIKYLLLCIMNPLENIIHYQTKYRLASHLFFWLIVLVLSVLSSRYYDGKEFTYGFALIGDGLYLLPQIIAAYFLTYFIMPAFFLKKDHLATAIYLFIGSYLICVLGRFLIVRIAEPIAGIPPNAAETDIEVLTDMPKLLFVYFFSIFSLPFVFMFFKLMKDQLRIQKRALTLEKEKAEAELQLLKTQLNPHFLFNTLNNIYSLSLTNSPLTSVAIGGLSDILDNILYRSNTPYVPLSQEITLLNNYIGLEKLRHEKALIVNLVKKTDRDINIAPLILLAIVENAFKHGPGSDTGAGFIDIDIKVNGAAFCFTVSNSYHPAATGLSSARIGLPNIRKQLDLIYPGKHTLVITPAEKTFTVKLTIKIA